MKIYTLSFFQIPTIFTGQDAFAAVAGTFYGVLRNLCPIVFELYVCFRESVLVFHRKAPPSAEHDAEIFWDSMFLYVCIHKIVFFREAEKIGCLVLPGESAHSHKIFCVRNIARHVIAEKAIGNHGERPVDFAKVEVRAFLIGFQILRQTVLHGRESVSSFTGVALRSARRVLSTGFYGWQRYGRNAFAIRPACQQLWRSLLSWLSILSIRF